MNNIAYDVLPNRYFAKIFLMHPQEEHFEISGLNSLLRETILDHCFKSEKMMTSIYS